MHKVEWHYLKKHKAFYCQKGTLYCALSANLTIAQIETAIPKMLDVIKRGEEYA
jgi:hypothetical protein